MREGNVFRGIGPSVPEPPKECELCKFNDDFMVQTRVTCNVVLNAKKRVTRVFLFLFRQ